MESPPSQGGSFMSGTQWGTRFAKVLSPGWKELETGEGEPCFVNNALSAGALAEVSAAYSFAAFRFL